jgi:ribosomal-protein-alanine N-acetyltransferase
MAFPNELLHGIEIREMTLDDVPVLAAIEGAADPNPWTEDIFRRELQISISHTLVAIGKQEQGDQIAGFVTFWMVADELQLHKIAVRRQDQRQGIARKLFQAMTNQALACGLSRATLEVRRTNEAAIKLYETFGYRVTAVRKGYYGGVGEDAMMMSAELRPAVLLKH